jgi:transcriptional regulator with XRE-family HTH domain
MTLRQCLLAAREEKGMNLAQAGEKSGVSYAAISTWERGDRSPQFEKLEQVCMLAYDMSLIEFLQKYGYNGEEE